MHNEAVVCLSGGVDSTTLFYYVQEMGYDTVQTIAIDYNQENKKEIEYAREIADGWSFTIVKCSIPKADDWVYPNRNAIILSLAASIGGEGCDIYFGATKDDFVHFRDCRAEFFIAMSSALALGAGIRGVYTPFLNWTKTQVVEYGLKSSVKVPYDKTWTCYMGEDQPCMTCLACKDRISAFAALKYDYYGEPWEEQWAVGVL